MVLRLKYRTIHLVLYDILEFPKISHHLICFNAFTAKQSSLPVTSEAVAVQCIWIRTIVHAHSPTRGRPQNDRDQLLKIHNVESESSVLLLLAWYWYWAGSVSDRLMVLLWRSLPVELIYTRLNSPNIWDYHYRLYRWWALGCNFEADMLHWLGLGFWVTDAHRMRC